MKKRTKKNAYPIAELKKDLLRFSKRCQEAGYTSGFGVSGPGFFFTHGYGTAKEVVWLMGKAIQDAINHADEIIANDKK